MLLPMNQVLGPLGVSRRQSLLNDLVAYWKLDEGAGTTRADSTGRGNDLSDNNSVGQAAGKISNAGLFVRASDQFLLKTDNADLSCGAASITFAGWLYLNTLSITQFVLAKGTSSDLEYDMDVISGSNLLRFGVYSTGAGSFAGAIAATFGALSSATWYFIVASYNATLSRVEISVNNGTVDTGAVSFTPQDSTGSLRLGRRGAGTGLDGRLDEWGVWRRVLSSSDRERLYNASDGLTYPF